MTISETDRIIRKVSEIEIPSGHAGSAVDYTQGQYHMAIAVPSGSGNPIPDVPRPTSKTPERELTSLGDKLAKARGFEIHPTTTALNPSSGFPQRLYFKDGVMVVVEYLGPGKKMSTNQRQWAAEFDDVVRKSTGTVKRLTITPSDWDQLRKALQ